MPAKKKGADAPSKKTIEKKKDKVIEDKTFGLKNKKGKKQQQFIKNVQTQVKFGQQSSQKLESLQYEAKKKKQSEMEAKKEMESIFKPTVAKPQKLSADADPKSVLCVFHRQGMCTKGDKCKFSHDLSMERKSEKKSMYVDARDLESDTIDTWDEDKLKEVVERKHGAKIMPKTEIVCKYFLQAIEDGKYGWFWECPNGGDKCMYRHCLPPGFVFKTKKKSDEIENVEDEISMEQLVEEERQKLLSSGKVLTKVTLESFLAWKRRKLKEKRDKLAQDTSKKKEAMKAGRTVGISGREMFEFNPDMKGQDEGGEGDDEETVVMIRHREEEEGDEDEATEGATALDLTNYKEWIPDEEEEEEEDVALGEANIEIDEQLFAEEEGDVLVDEELFDEQLILEEELLLTNNIGIEKMRVEDSDSSSDKESVE